MAEAPPQTQKGQAPAGIAIETLACSKVFHALDSRHHGLTHHEAADRLSRYGRNSLKTLRPQPLWRRLGANFTHLMALLLWAAGATALVAGMPELAVAIWLVNLINGGFSFWQEFKAERATEALLEVLPTYCHVRRNGEDQRTLAEELVPGDVILLAEGDRISADCRLVQVHSLRVDQSTLTGESRPVTKDKEPLRGTVGVRAEVANLVFAGTTVTAGSGEAVVYATGMATEFGRIAHLTQTLDDTQSPLQQELRRLTRTVTWLAGGIGLLLFAAAYYLVHVSLWEAFIFGLGMVVAFVPEGMLPTVTLSLAMGVQRMARRNALVKRLSAIETLGCTSVICTDKTGTLTKNEMTVREIWLPGRALTVSGAGYLPSGQVLERGEPIEPDGDLQRCLTAAGLCNNAKLAAPRDSHCRWEAQGDPTEAALIVAARKAGVDLGLALRQHPRITELPFDSYRKRMSTVHRLDGRRLVYVKGAPQEILPLCSSWLANGEVAALDDDRRRLTMEANDRYAADGLRVLAVAMRELPAEAPLDVTTVEQELTFLGLMAMLDPPRPEVAEAVATCRQAGIRVVMLTGDYGLTAAGVARKIGIVGEAEPSLVTGRDLDVMDDAALAEALRREVIFSRLAPEHKLRVVSALQQLGHVVAVTGDGVNDAPALKKADMGVAMGRCGTDVAKEAGDMILTDDNFASIVSAIEEGRAVYSNIRRFATYVFTSNMAEAVPFAVTLFSGGLIPLPLTVMQVLSIDVGTDMVPAIGLGAEAPEAGVMDNPPRPRRARLLSHRILARALLWYGLLEGLAGMSGYYFVQWRHGWPTIPLAAPETPLHYLATTMTLAAIVMGQVGTVFACRSERQSLWRLGLLSNRMVVAGVLVELGLLLAMVYVPPLQRVFHTAPLGWQEWLCAAIWAPFILLLDEGRKAWARRHQGTTVQPNGSGDAPK